ncbi:hypothetical protein B0H34DRAFT_46844 [Crassisporium funariophilum]|nr:hypothetical protein B0H34DRAFT_46844 [Crassisporium funariophilum]
MSSLNSRRGWNYGGTGTGADSEGQIITTGGLNIRTQAISGNATKQADIITFEFKTHPEVFVHVEQHELRDAHHHQQHITMMIESEHWGQMRLIRHWKRNGSKNVTGELNVVMLYCRLKPFLPTRTS